MGAFDLDDDALEGFHLAPSELGRRLRTAVRKFVLEDVEPMSQRFDELASPVVTPGSYGTEQLELLEAVKKKARRAGLWNLFFTHGEHGRGLSNLDYAYIAAELGRNRLASECMNCSPPDSGNMEILAMSGSDEQKSRWLAPLLDGSARSAFAMSEPNVASSDARNISCQAVLEDDQWVIRGDKYFVTGAGDPRCLFVIIVVVTEPDAPPRERHSHLIVPMDAPGVELVEAMTIFGHDHPPGGHWRVRFDGARVPRDHVLLGRGRGFEISQMRLGPGRIHGCMRAIGAADKALELMVQRGLAREAFGKPIVRLGKNTEVIARARIEIEAMRLMVLRAARAMDVMPTDQARLWVSAVKAMVPQRVCAVIDEAIQVHGATGLSQWAPLAEMYMEQRAFRLGDGPDEVHHMVVGRGEIARWASTD